MPGVRAETRVEVSVDFFYDSLGPAGIWVELEDHGYCWQPNIAVSDARWRPYSDGYWVYTDLGWTWMSHEDFGWATYHYGRWVRLRDRGWFWYLVQWGPAWVSWRTGGDHVGWAPLPPRRSGEVDFSHPITTQVDIEFDMAPTTTISLMSVISVSPHSGIGLRAKSKRHLHHQYRKRNQHYLYEFSRLQLRT